ncbi:MAG: DUF4317 domain-containing protein [Eubacteriales bacterium]|nr:DUF4317 domain-containing protein [Eubacteriales bacterium]
MNKKEISEIKKQFTPTNCAITRISGCYVDAEKNKKTEFSRTFLNLSEEEMFKYFEIFKKTLSGTLGKNLMSMDFPLEQEYEGGTQYFLLKLRDSGLKDEALVNTFFDKIIENYSYPENYYIILIHGAYDIPGKTKDNLDMDDASDEVFQFLLCSICPVKLSKAGLFYNTDTNNIEERIRDWIVEMPDLGFLFPVFQDRSTDIHSILYYSKNANELHYDLIEELLGCTPPMTATNQKETFNSLIEDTLGNSCDLDTVRTIHEKLSELVEEQKESPEPVVLQKEEVKRLLETSGVDSSSLENFDEKFEVASGGESAPLMVSNLINTKRFEIKTVDIQIHVSPDKTDLIETRTIEGRKYLMIPMDESIEVNGIHVKSLANAPSSDSEEMDKNQKEEEEGL